jgi:hypothetical protein
MRMCLVVDDSSVMQKNHPANSGGSGLPHRSRPSTAKKRNGTEMDVQFLKGRQGKKKSGLRKEAHLGA